MFSGSSAASSLALAGPATAAATAAGAGALAVLVVLGRRCGRRPGRASPGPARRLLVLVGAVSSSWSPPPLLRRRRPPRRRRRRLPPWPSPCSSSWSSRSSDWSSWSWPRSSAASSGVGFGSSAGCSSAGAAVLRVRRRAAGLVSACSSVASAGSASAGSSAAGASGSATGAAAVLRVRAGGGLHRLRRLEQRHRPRRARRGRGLGGLGRGGSLGELLLGELGSLLERPARWPPRARQRSSSRWSSWPRPSSRGPSWPPSSRSSSPAAPRPRPRAPRRSPKRLGGGLGRLDCLGGRLGGRLRGGGGGLLGRRLLRGRLLGRGLLGGGLLRGRLPGGLLRGRRVSRRLGAPASTGASLVVDSGVVSRSGVSLSSMCSPRPPGRVGARTRGSVSFAGPAYRCDASLRVALRARGSRARSGRRRPPCLRRHRRARHCPRSAASATGAVTTGHAVSRSGANGSPTVPVCGSSGPWASRSCKGAAADLESGDLAESGEDVVGSHGRGSVP